MRSATTCGISPGFPGLSPTRGQVAHVLLTRLPLGTFLPCGRKALARLACVMHAASVNPEPGSNSPFKTETQDLALRLSHSSVVKVLTPQITLREFAGRIFKGAKTPAAESAPAILLPPRHALQALTAFLFGSPTPAGRNAQWLSRRQIIP